MYKNLWKTRQFSLVPKRILTPHLMTVVKQLSYLKYFMGQWLKKKYHLQEVSMEWNMVQEIFTTV